ncbi:MAG: DoxX family protein [Bacteroidota bacterium]|nr:DoxX family protein [Bacteroidota bacterium]
MVNKPGAWILTLVLAVFFIYVSYRKFSGNEVTVGHFREWGYGKWLVTAIAILELSGAILLLFPATATSGALLLTFVMAGATYTLVSHEVWRTAAITMTTLVLLLWLGYMRWNQSWMLMLFKRGT